MFDFGFSEMLVIGAVALVVLGPEPSPTVAKTAGEWIGKAQRFVSQVKSDIDREADFAELKKLQDQAKSLADEVKSTVQKSANDIQKSANALNDTVSETKTSLDESVSAVQSSLNDMEKEVQAATSSIESATTNTVSTSATTEEEIADFYGWTGVDPQPPTPTYEWREPKIFKKRYHSGPSVDELAREVERLRRELGLRETKLGGSNRRYNVRARSNRVRIYR